MMHGGKGAMVALLLVAGMVGAETPKIKVLLVDGQNNHNWRATSPVVQATLEQTGRFAVTVATSPDRGQDMATFKPAFDQYDVVVSNYNGDPWAPATRKAFEDYVAAGGGFVSLHAANNSFPGWPDYNRMIGLGGWGGRSEKDGPYVRFRDGQVVRDTVAGRGGSHGKRHPFVVITRAPEHPIVKGLPAEWMHNVDELYDRLRGPAENLTVLATAYADPATGGSGEHEPILMTIDYGKGRVFHTTLGHDVEAMKCVGFQVTLARGTEWAATGKVTLPIPADFPPADKVSLR